MANSSNGEQYNVCIQDNGFPKPNFSNDASINIKCCILVVDAATTYYTSESAHIRGELFAFDKSCLVRMNDKWCYFFSRLLLRVF